MPYTFGDGFDLYADNANDVYSYWDVGGIPNFNLSNPGRFGGHRMNTLNSSDTMLMAKTSGVNDPVHHIFTAFIANIQGGGMAGTQRHAGFQLWDGGAAQCSLIYRRDGTWLLTTGSPTGAVVATYPGGVVEQGVWYTFDFEIGIHNTNGSFAVRKNGNPVNDFTATGLNTRGGTTNNYANKLQVCTGPEGINATVGFDDIFWQSDIVAGNWLGDIRCYTRLPTIDAGVQFARVPGTNASNASCVNEARQDGLTSYVYSSLAGQSDFYAIAGIGSTPSKIFAVTTRGYMTKSDAGSRTAAVRLKSGATIVASPTLVLTTSGWTWAYRTDVTDPNTGSEWTAAAVNALNIGPTVVF